MFDSYLEARLQAAPLLLEIVGACKQTRYRKVGMSPARVVRPAAQAPLFHNSGLTMFGSYLEARLQAAPLLLENFGACKQTWSRKTSLCATSCVSPAPKAPLCHNSGLTMFDSIVAGDFWGWSRKHGLGRRACVLLVLSAPPQKPHFFTTLG